MKKILIVTITAALLLCAGLCTAGCIDTASEPSGSFVPFGSFDPIVGTWIAQDSTTAVSTIFNYDNTGFYLYMIGEDKTAETETMYSESSSAGYELASFIWIAEGDNRYSVQFSDKTTGSCTLNPDNQTFVTNTGVVYGKMENETENPFGSEA